MGRRSSVRSRKVKPGSRLWVDSTAVGTMAHSTPMAERMGSATVREHFPRQEMSWMLMIRFIGFLPDRGCCQMCIFAARPVRSRAWCRAAHRGTATTQAMMPLVREVISLGTSTVIMAESVARSNTYLPMIQLLIM